MGGDLAPYTQSPQALSHRRYTKVASHTSGAYGQSFLGVKHVPAEFLRGLGSAHPLMFRLRSVTETLAIPRTQPVPDQSQLRYWLSSHMLRSSELGVSCMHFCAFTAQRGAKRSIAFINTSLCGENICMSD
ncbi:Uncharacterized protein HZ326_2925 [Fusarium oxysporum f. sp. albedinis]|nr:Uncharacterized protein HZ326_2925 [Fusarium oxysporum f. sp. albedinis]